MTTTAETRARLAEIDVPVDLFIDGRFQPAASGKRFEVIEPATGEHLAWVARGDVEDVDRAVSAARASFRSGSWSRRSPGERKAVLLAVADAVLAAVDDFALVEAVDGGKLLSDTTGWDIPGAASVLRWYAESIDKLYGEVAPTAPDQLAIVTREPLGVIGAVVPWNYPLEMAMWKLAPALAAGNSVVLKPAEETPLTALMFARIAVQNGLPAGVLNVVTGLGPEAGAALGRHPGVDVIAFTGSTSVGAKFLGYAAESNLKQVWLECGGKSANLVFEDVADLDGAASAAAAGIFSTAGQVCSANSRLLVQRSIADEFLALVVAKAREVVVGDPLDAASTMGPLVSSAQLERVTRFIASGVRDATLVTGGGGPAGAPGGGFFVEPTIFTDVRPDAEIFTEEIFGPVLAVTIFDTEEEAVELANATRFGLAASVFTDNIHRAHRVSNALEAGTVSINRVDALDVVTPFGGVKQSGFGRDLSLHALDKYTSLKTRWFA